MAKKRMINGKVPVNEVRQVGKAWEKVRGMFKMNNPGRWG